MGENRNRAVRQPRSGLLLALAFGLAAPGVAHGHASHPTDLAWRACDHRALSDTCSFDNGHAVHRGTCRSIGGGLICVRNQPLRPSGSAPTAPARTSLLAAVGLGGVALLAGAAAVRRSLRRARRSRVAG